VAHQEREARHITCQISIRISHIHSIPTQRSHLCDQARQVPRILHDPQTTLVRRQSIHPTRMRIDQLRTQKPIQMSTVLRRSQALLIRQMYLSDQASHTRLLRPGRRLRLRDGDLPTLTAQVLMAHHRTDVHQQSIPRLILVAGLQSMRITQRSGLRTSVDLRTGRHPWMARSVPNWPL
jgi:hypothetical protein